ncbi:MAG: 16S rRNA (uracil(1498)-N(3))-methyltransferase [Deltaproteobacteria bacterium]
MALPRFLVEPGRLRQAGESIVLNGSEAHHLSRVLRLGPGEEIDLLDGEGVIARARVETSGRETVIVTVLNRRILPDDRLPVDLYCSLLKGERMEWLVQKAVELGTRSIHPVLAEHSVPRLESSRLKTRVLRLNEVSRQALKQCRGGHATSIHPILPLDAALREAKGTPVRFVLDERGCAAPLASEWQNAEHGQPIAILVGPEGGLSQSERSLAHEQGFRPVTMGKRILRAETAAIAALAYLRLSMDAAGH